MAASRERRANAGALMASLIKDFHEEDSFRTLYGGFEEEAEDAEFGLDAISDEGSDVDIDEDEDQDLEDEAEDNGDDEDEGRRRRKVRKPFLKRKQPPTSSQKPAKKSKPSTSAFDESAFSESETSSTDTDAEYPTAGGDNLDVKSDSKQAVSASRRSIRDSTAAKRFETEELEQLRELRRQETGPRVKVTYRIPTQRERLTKSKQTEKANIADLEKYRRDEEENEKKRSRKTKVVRGPFDTCFISRTAAVPTLDEAEEMGASSLSAVEESESLIGAKPGGKYTHNILAFRTEELFYEAFPDQKREDLVPLEKKLDELEEKTCAINGKKPSRKAAAPEVETAAIVGKKSDGKSQPEVKKAIPDRTCIITGKQARYLDPLTRMYYYDSQALKAIHGVIYKHFTTKTALVMNMPKVEEFIDWCDAKYQSSMKTAEMEEIGRYNYSPNEMKNS